MSIANGEFQIYVGQSSWCSKHGRERLIVGQIVETANEYDVELFYGPRRLIFFQSLRLKKSAGWHRIRKERRRYKYV